MDLDVLYHLFHQLPKYQKLYDPQGFQKEFRMMEEIKQDENGYLTGVLFSRSSLGAMCSDRVLAYKFDLARLSENPKKFCMNIYTLDKDSYDIPEGTVCADMFKYGTYEQVGDDVVMCEA